MVHFLPYIQIAISILLIVSILLQQRGTALSQSFGGDGGAWASRRGAERWIFISSIIFSVLFFAVAFMNLVV